MAKQNINIGVSPNDGTGDVVREAFRKSKENFDELYARATGDMNKSTYDADNSGAVDAADKVTGVDAAGNVTYYGKDAAGNIGFHSFSEDKVAEYNDQIAGFDGVLYIDVANFKLYLWDDVNTVYKLANNSYSYEYFGELSSGSIATAVASKTRSGFWRVPLWVAGGVPTDMPSDFTYTTFYQIYTTLHFNYGDSAAAREVKITDYLGNIYKRHSDDIWRKVSAGYGKQRTRKDITGTYDLLETDFDKHLFASGTTNILVDGNLMAYGSEVVVTNQGGALTINGKVSPVEVQAVNGSSKKVKDKGTAILYKTQFDPAFSLSGDLVKGNEDREEKYISAATYTLVEEDKYKFLSVRLTDTTITIPTGVFKNGDVIKGFCHSARATINSNLGYTTRPNGTTNKAWGYFEIKISSTSGDVGTQNADAAILTGEFISDKTFLKSPNGTLWEIEVGDAGTIIATDRGLNY